MGIRIITGCSGDTITCFSVFASHDARVLYSSFKTHPEVSFSYRLHIYSSGRVVCFAGDPAFPKFTIGQGFSKPGSLRKALIRCKKCTACPYLPFTKEIEKFFFHTWKFLGGVRA